MKISSRSLNSAAFLLAAFLLVGSTSLLLAPKARAVTALADIEAGDLIRGESLSAVYYMGADGFRYVFPNDKTYFTWYSNFDSVKWLSDADMAKIQIGGNVTYHPGVKMVKITSSATTYLVAHGGTLRAIQSEADATTLYGSDWNTKVDDVADAFFSNYTIGSEIEASEGDVASHEFGGTSSIDDDKELTAPAEVSIGTSGSLSSDTSTINAGETVRFTNDSSSSYTLLADDGSWGEIIAAGGQFVKRFSTAGTYTYYLKDTDSTGAVVVE